MSFTSGSLCATDLKIKKRPFWPIFIEGTTIAKRYWAEDILLPKLCLVDKREAERKRLAGDTVCAANVGEVQGLRRKTPDLKDNIAV